MGFKCLNVYFGTEIASLHACFDPPSGHHSRSLPICANLPQSDLAQVATELRAETIDAAATTGGHFGAGLGVVELTVALHYVFKTPEDRVIWDVSHQTYPHKILTGRRDRIRKIRQRDGLYGFAKRGESNFDSFRGGPQFNLNFGRPWHGGGA